MRPVALRGDHRFGDGFDVVRLEKVGSAVLETVVVNLHRPVFGDVEEAVVERPVVISAEGDAASLQAEKRRGAVKHAQAVRPEQKVLRGRTDDVSRETFSLEEVVLHVLVDIA